MFRDVRVSAEGGPELDLAIGVSFGKEVEDDPEGQRGGHITSGWGVTGFGTWLGLSSA